LLIAIDGAPPTIDPGRPSRSEKLSLTYRRLTNAAASLFHLGSDLVRRLRQRSQQNASIRNVASSAWQESAFRPIWQRVADGVTGKIARVLGKQRPQRHPAENATDTSALPSDHRAFIRALYDSVWSYTP